ncbi:tetratricopeptide repeat protein [Kiloniella litopenaei]|uniref:tetratricopeptide repeat protein n=1 Tax=Kiloniella litopenaei TaxID=1549748 RepID=UPI00069696B7|nr:SEL1-like repeat protein [Kiloniella litopenaei]
MKYLLSLLCFFYASSLWAADFNKGGEAAKRQDYATAIEEWTPLAEAGDAKVQYYLAVLYLNWRADPGDDRKAFKWFRRAADQGHMASQRQMGIFYLKG